MKFVFLFQIVYVQEREVLRDLFLATTGWCCGLASVVAIVALAFHKGTNSNLATLASVLLPAAVSGKASEDGSTPGSLCPHGESRREMEKEKPYRHYVGSSRG